jgi:cytochrome c biogenesis protein CcdA
MITAAPVVDLPLAFGAGVLTVAAPCILPMLPLLLGTSIEQSSKWRPVFIVAGFAGSFTACAFLFGTFANRLGLSQEAIRNGALLMLGLFGVLMVWPRPFEALAVRMNGVINFIGNTGAAAKPGHLGGLLLGASMGAIWTPCAGPALGSILVLVASENAQERALLLLGSYAAGASLPMLAIAYGGRHAAALVRRMTRHAVRLQQLGGILILLTATAMYLQFDTLAAVWLSTLI